MQIKFWETASGRSPVLKFIEALPDDHAARIMKRIDHLERQGLNLLAAAPNKLKQLRGYKGLFELIIDYGGVFYRVLFVIVDGIAWLLAGFKKKDNHTRLSYIETALRRSSLIPVASA